MYICMDNRLRISKVMKLLKKYHGRELGLLSLRNIIGIYITTNENTITGILRTLGGVGIIKEVEQGHFLINANINLDNTKLDLLDEKDEREGDFNVQDVLK